MTPFFSRILVVSGICLLAACSTPGKVAPEPTPAPTPQPAPDPVRPMAVPETGLTQQDLAALRDPANPLSKRSVYFDLDSSVIKAESAGVVETHGKFLAKKAGVKVTLRGNTDERGSREYNLALGQRRAEAMKQALKAYGVPDEQVETVSFGEEKPLAPGHDKAAWEKNRRADIAYPGE